MPEIKLKPIRESTEDYDRVEKTIKQLFREQIYFPLLAAMVEPKRTLTNSSDAVAEALSSGRITYSRGSFRGRFNSEISKELKSLGAHWDSKQGTWRIPKSSLSPDILGAISVSRARFDETLAAIDRTLAKILPTEVAGKLKVQKLFDATLWKTESEFQKSVKGITIAPNLSPAQATRISTEWEKNLQLYVADFTAKETSELRKRVKETVFTGARREALVKVITASYDVSINKAKFLAKQETSLLMAKHKQTRYEEAGVNEYIWKCVHNAKDKSPLQRTPGNVRYYHGLLDGKKFTWRNPPVVNEKGDRKNPGQDYNCRCYAIPVVRF